jgi:hypothetical protein
MTFGLQHRAGGIAGDRAVRLVGQRDDFDMAENSRRELPPLEIVLDLLVKHAIEIACGEGGALLGH